MNYKETKKRISDVANVLSQAYNQLKQQSLTIIIFSISGCISSHFTPSVGISLGKLSRINPGCTDGRTGRSRIVLKYSTTTVSPLKTGKTLVDGLVTCFSKFFWVHVDGEVGTSEVFSIFGRRNSGRPSADLYHLTSFSALFAG